MPLHCSALFSPLCFSLRWGSASAFTRYGRLSDETKIPSFLYHSATHTAASGSASNSTRDNRIMRLYRAPLLILAFTFALAAQDVRPKDVREIGKGGSVALPRLGELLKHPDTAIRAEALRQITDIGTLASLDPL